jgi:hypothetical protein
LKYFILFELKIILNSTEMSDWKSLDLNTDGVGLEQLHSSICDAIAFTEGNCLWIAEVDLDVKYKVYQSIQEMCEDIWYEWPGNDLDDFINEHKISKEIPAITSEHAREYYVMQTMKLAEEFWEKSKEVVINNPDED